MSALIGRLSKLTGPRYTMDVAIALATDFWPKDRIQNIVYNDDGDPWVYFTDGPDLPLPPAYTASVDSAIALAERVLPGKGIDLLREAISELGKKYDWHICLKKPEQAKELPIQVCIALLRAKEASKL